MRNQKGITLIALVITIIVLLILAGVSIAMLTGNNGLLTQSTKARDDTARAEVVERINMELQAAYSEALQNPSKDFNSDLTDINNNLAGKATAKFTTPTLTITGTGSYSGISGTVTVGSSPSITLAQ